MNLDASVLQLIKELRKDATTTGISTMTGLNFYYLEPQAKNIYPVFYPLLASIPRRNPMFNGMKIGGLGINWKAVTAIDVGGYPGVSEGNRNAFINFQEKDFYAPYKFLGKDVEVSFQAQDTGLGFDDNIAIAQLGQLNALLNDEERMLLYGNSGPNTSGGTYGYALGVTPTPTAVAIATTTGSNGNSTGIAPGPVTVFCVALTPWGTRMQTSIGVRLPYVRTNADGSTDIINGGSGQISAASATATATAPLGSVQVGVAAVQGAVGYAWYVSSNAAPTTANANYWFTTSAPTAIISNLPPGTNQLANATDPTTSKGLSTDNSYNNLDFDGMMTWGFNWASNPSTPSYWKDFGGKGFTSNGDGTIAEFEAVLDWAWLTYKLTFDKIYVGGALINAVSKAIITSGSGASAAQRIIFDRDADGTLKGGTKLVEYRSKYSNAGAPKILPVLTHPWQPDGTVFFHLQNNPYPAAGNTIPGVFQMMSLEDHFSIKWPYRKLQHELGTYCFETLQCYIPFGIAVLTGLANKVN
jgi:hypothetical protein